jgi:DNA gyrase/topoisomerase IV subunit A
MLSQRIAKFFLFQHAGIQVARCRTELEEVSEEFSTTLADLSSATRDKPAIAAELEGVTEQWHSLQSAITTRDSNLMASARKVFTTSENLLQRMDMAVELYARLPG